LPINSIRFQGVNYTNKLFKWDKLQLAGSAALHILANYNLPLNRALHPY
jgi:hypothetical protein